MLFLDLPRQMVQLLGLQKAKMGGRLVLGALQLPHGLGEMQQAKMGGRLVWGALQLPHGLWGILHLPHGLGGMQQAKIRWRLLLGAILLLHSLVELQQAKKSERLLVIRICVLRRLFS